MIRHCVSCSAVAMQSGHTCDCDRAGVTITNCILAFPTRLSPLPSGNRQFVLRFHEFLFYLLIFLFFKNSTVVGNHMVLSFSDLSRSTLPSGSTRAVASGRIVCVYCQYSVVLCTTRLLFHSSVPFLPELSGLRNERQDMRPRAINLRASVSPSVQREQNLPV